MKKALKITGMILLLLYALIVIWNSSIGNVFFAMPSGMKKEDVCFLAPGLTWNSTASDLEVCFGIPVERGERNEITGNVTDAYFTIYENRTVVVYATRMSFSLNNILSKRRVHSYIFHIQCSDEEDEKAVFEKLCQQLIDSKAYDERFSYTKDSASEISAEIDYGPTGIYYYIEYDAFDSEYRVRLHADALY